MKRKLTVAAMAAAMFAPAAWAQMGPGMMGGYGSGGGGPGGYGAGPGMMGGYGPGGYGALERGDERRYDALDLSDAQREKIARIRRDARKRIDAVLTPEQRQQLQRGRSVGSDDR